VLGLHTGASPSRRLRRARPGLRYDHCGGSVWSRKLIGPYCVRLSPQPGQALRVERGIKPHFGTLRHSRTAAIGRYFAGMRSGASRSQVVAVVVSTFALATSLAAQESQDTVKPDTVFRVEGIAVKVARAVATAGGASALDAPLDSMAVPPAPTLEEVLRQMPLILIRENSRGEAQPQVRGMESRQVAVLVDGVPITLGWDDRTDLSVIPLTAARHLTLVRGLSSVLYGPNALGGAILVGIGDLPDGSPRTSEPFQFMAGVDQLGNGAVALGLGTVVRHDGGALTATSSRATSGTGGHGCRSRLSCSIRNGAYHRS
jgi:outer membrane receptor protein involved in Fe transport